LDVARGYTWQPYIIWPSNGVVYLRWVLAPSIIWDTIRLLILALLLGLVISIPQWVRALHYLPKSIRSDRVDKHLGRAPLKATLMGLVAPRSSYFRGRVHGVHFPEIALYMGIPGLILALMNPNPWLWGLLLVSGLCAGGFLPRYPLRVPARFLYLVSLTLTLMSVEGLRRIGPFAALLALIVLLQAWDLCTNASSLMPMEPFIQRWERPSKAYHNPMTRFLERQPGNFRVSGLSYPNTTGQIQHIKTLGYNGGSQLKAMAKFRGDADPNGSGGFDWFSLGRDGPKLDWYGVKFAYTYRPLQGKWIPTRIPHLFRNTKAAPAPSFSEIGRYPQGGG